MIDTWPLAERSVVKVELEEGAQPELKRSGRRSSRITSRRPQWSLSVRATPSPSSGELQNFSEIAKSMEGKGIGKKMSYPFKYVMIVIDDQGHTVGRLDLQGKTYEEAKQYADDNFTNTKKLPHLHQVLFCEVKEEGVWDSNP